MSKSKKTPIEVLIVALPETAGSALYGMLDVLNAAGNIWQTLTRSGDEQQLFDVRIVGNTDSPFTCGNSIPVTPDYSLATAPDASIIIIPELWLGPDEDISESYSDLLAWIRRQYKIGATLYSACSGAVLLAATGLLDGREATSHWGYQDLFRTRFPKVQFCPDPNLVFADPQGRIVTAGGTSSWHDLAIHIISRHGSPGEALRVAKAYLLKLHGDGQLPYASLVRSAPHTDAAVKRCEEWLAENFHRVDAVNGVMQYSKLAGRTIKRRFKAATGSTLIDYIQNLRIEEAKRLLESSRQAVEEISATVSYEDVSFFRRLFKRRTGTTPGQYRRIFQSILEDSAMKPTQ